MTDNFNDRAKVYTIDNKENISQSTKDESLNQKVIKVKKQHNDLNMKIKYIVFCRNLTILLFAAIITIVYINRTGMYPWGSDTFGHLFKGNILSDSIAKGELFVNYNQNWYNGIQPFRYWAPLPYYILAFINLNVKNILVTYNVYIFFIFLLGGFGWLLWGYYLNSQNIGLIFSILWFFIPDNLRVLFSEGNLPFVMITAFLPFIFLYYYRSVKESKVKDYLILAFLMGTITLTHAMLSAMVGLSLFILWTIMLLTHTARFKNLLTIIYAFLGIMVTTFWLYPALRGGIMNLDKSAVSEVMASLTHPLSSSLNPLLRFSNIEVYYYGLGFAVVALIGLLFSTKNERAPFIAALFILLGTTKLALPLLVQLPMNQLFWMERFTAISMALILIAILIWKTLRRSILILLISFLIIDSGISFYLLGHNGNGNTELSKTIDTASSIAVQRIGVLDSSTFGSYPSYYISYNSSKGSKNQVYGWAWQGAATSKNIVMINTALENGYYRFMFDRLLELGADVLILRKEFIGDFNDLNVSAKAVGYMKYYEDNSVILYKYPVSGSFGTSVYYKGIAIGNYAPNISYLFPQLQTGFSPYIDDYSFEELNKIAVIYLSGFVYRDKTAAENLILKLSKNGVRVVVDMEGQTESFLGVTPQPIVFNKNYINMVYKGERLKTNDFPKGFESFKTCFLSGITNTDSYIISNYRYLNYIGTKNDKNIVFLGVNLPYYAFLTKDHSAVRILEEVLNNKSEILPKRIIESIEITNDGNLLNIKSKIPNVIVPIAALDAFEKIKGNYIIENNLIYLKTPDLKIKVIYPYLKTGMILSIIFLIIIIMMSVFLAIYQGKTSRSLNIQSESVYKKRRAKRKRRFKYRR